MDSDGKWADRKAQRAPLSLKNAGRREVTEQILSGRATGASPKGLVAQVGGGAALPVRKHKKSSGVKHHRVPENTTLLPELADDASQDDSVSSPWGDVLPVAGKKLSIPPPLGDLRAVPLNRGEEGPITMTKLNQDYQDVMKKLKDQKKLPHERDVTPRRTGGGAHRSGSAGSSRRHSAQNTSATPEPAPLSHRRYTEDGNVIAQPLSALGHLASISEGEDEKAEDPDTDTGADGAGGVVVTGRKMGRIRVVVRKRPFRDGETGEDCVEVNSPEIHIGALK
ncbi:mitotic centromere-associated kinesin, putative, partial [Bodo saltans]